MPNLEHYRGREQGFIKHALIEKYIVPFTIKIGSTWKEIVFLDAFAGPWGAQSVDLSDTSFAVALHRLEEGLEALKKIRNRSPRIRAILIEKDPKAFPKLNAFVQGWASNGVKAECHHGEFEELVPALKESINPEQSFLFSLIDPKGWTGLSMAVIAPLIRRRSSEVLVNVMTSFVHRFSDVEKCRDSYKDFFGRSGVRDIITNAPQAERQDVVVREYCRSLRELCGYKHVSSCVVLEPDKKGVKYFMVFATNNPMGIKVFKEAEAHAADLQDEVKFAKEFGDQKPLFAVDQIERVSVGLRQKYRSLAFARVEAMFETIAEASYTEVFCKAMAMPLVTEAELLEFLNDHSRLQLVLDGKRRTKPDIQNKKDRVIRADAMA